MRRNRYSGLMLTAVFILVGGTGATAMAQLPGDLDANGEVDLIDLTAFVGCLNGPDFSPIAPACDPADFDPDMDIDLRDFAGFQSRFGFGQGPPQIVSFTPTPGEWVVDDTGLTKVTIGFSEPVIVPTDPAEAIDVWGLVSGTITGFATSYDPSTFELTVTFAAPLRDDQVTVVVDYTIEDVAGNPLDGEILDPKNAALPSGNEINGGQGVFRIRVLQGDANRDGVVDAADETLVDNSLNLCNGDSGFDAMADLNNDGCVDTADANIVTNALDNQLPITDGTPLQVLELVTDPAIPDQLFVIFCNDSNNHCLDDGGRILPQHPTFLLRTCFLVDAAGDIHVPDLVDVSFFANFLSFTFLGGLPDSENCTVNVSNALVDQSGSLLVAPGAQPCP